MGALTLDVADWILVLTALLGSLWLGHHRSRKTAVGTDSAIDYILAGRSLTAPLFAASLIATWYGAVLGAGEFVARYGVVMILCFGLPYYLVAAAYAALLTRRIRTAETVSIPDQIRRSYGPRSGTIAAILLLVISIPAPYMLTLGVVVASLTSLPLPAGIVLGSAVSLAIVARGGLRSDVRANVLQVTVMYAGFIALAIGCVATFGSVGTMWHALPTGHRTPTGALGWTGVAVWFFIALQTFVDPNFHVRAAATRTPSTARTGLIWSIVGWIIFDGLQLLIGLYAVAYVPIADPSETYLVVAQAALPMVGKGLFVAAILAAVMSTLDGYALVSATTIGHDLIDVVRGGGHRRSSLLIGLTATGVIGTLVAIAIPSIVDLIAMAASIVVPALLLPLVFSYARHRRLPAAAAPADRRAAWWMLAPAGGVVLSMVLRWAGVLSIEPMFVGLAISVVLAPFQRSKHEDVHPR